METAAATQFQRDGWTVLRGVVSPARVAELRGALDRLVPAWQYASGFSGRVVEVAGVSRGAPVLDAFVRDPALARLAALALRARRIQLLQDTALIKPASDGGRVEWHQDYSYFGFLDVPAVATLRVALTACTRDNGCMRVISGSHQWGLQGGDLSFQRSAVGDALEALPAHLRDEAREREVLLELQPGDVSLHHCLTFHGSAENRSPAPRKTLAIRFADAACRLRPERLPSPQAAGYFTADADGHLAGPLFPVLFDASAASAG